MIAALFIWLVAAVVTVCLTVKWLYGENALAGWDYFCLLFIIAVCVAIWPVILLGVLLAKSEYGS